jgi:adenosine deaminase
MSALSVSSYEQRQKWREQQLQTNDAFVTNMLKVELHVHIEGTMTPDLRWKLAQRNGIQLFAGAQKSPLTSLEEVEDAYRRIRGRIGAASADSSKSFTFFQAYYDGFDLLLTEEDYYDLALGYFERAATMNIRYCEPFFDPQGHTRRGISMAVIMNAFERAQNYAERVLNVGRIFVRKWSKLTNLR